MAVTRTKLFDSIANGAAWDAGVVFNRTNGIPIDKFSVFKSLLDEIDPESGEIISEGAINYARNNPVAYPGQLIAVVPENIEEDPAKGYIILADGSIKELGADIDLSPIESSIEAIYALLDLDYDKTLAFDIEELVVDFDSAKAMLGTAILGQMILGRAR